jgi:prepilin-type processing-associated H-X9-DG protein
MREDPLPLNYATPDTKKQPIWVRWVLLAGIIFFSWVIIAELLTSSTRSPADADRAKCASRLHQVGLALAEYASVHKGQYPDSFSTLLLASPLMPYIFVCPASNDQATGAATTQAMADELKKPGYVSFIYLGKGLTEKTVLPNQIIAYETLANHSDGINVLLGDGHAEFVNVARAKKIIGDASAGNSPVLLPP